MATLSNTKIKDTYQSLVKFNDNGNITTSPKRLTDGFGNVSPFYVSTTQVGIGTSPNSSYDLHVYGNVKVGANLDVSGNLTVNGTLTYLNVTDLAVEDPLIKLAKDNDANTLDIGLFGKYAISTNVKYKGFFNDASDNKFKIFTGLTTEPTTTVDVSDSGYAVGTLVANLEGNVTGTVSSLSNHDTNDLVEGSVNLYYTNARADARVNLQTGANLDLSSKDTDDLSEGTTNLYFTTTRARASFTAGTGVTITDGEIAIGQDVATDSNVTFGNITGSAISGTTGTFSGQVTIPETPTADAHAASKKYVDDNSSSAQTLAQTLALGNISGSNNLIIQDDDELILGSGSDFKAYHNQTNTLFRINTGDLIFNSFTTDGDIKFQLDNGSGSLTEYLRLDGGTQNTIVTRPIQFNGYATSLNIFESYFERTGNPNMTNTNLYLADTTDMAAEVGGSIVFSGKYKTAGTYLSGGPFIRAYKENANDSNYSFGLKFGIRLNGSVSNDTALTIKPNKDVVVSEGDLKVDSSSGDSVIILDNSSQLLRIDQNSIRTTTNSQITLMTNNSNALQLNTSQQAFFYSDVLIPEHLKHSGDEDTYLQFQTDRQTLVAGGTEFIDFANTTQDYITIGGGSDIDVKLVSSTNNKFIFIQGSDGYIGINDLTPSYEFDVNAETRFGLAVNFDNNRYNRGGTSTLWYATDTNARVNMDARVEGTGVMIHKWNRNADDDAYLSYEENWYDGNSYNKISSYNDGFMLSGNIRLSSYGAGNITGTLSKLVGFEANGGLIDVPLSTFIDGSGSTGYIPYFTDASSIATSSVYYESADKVRHIATIGPNDSVRKGFFAEDDTDMAADIGGQIGFRYKYTSAGDYTEGALIRMYKLNSTSADYSSGLKFQVRNTGDELSSKMTLNPSGFLGLGTTTPDYQLDIENSGSAIMRLHAGVNSSASLRLKNDAQDWDVNTQTNDTFAIYNQTAGTQPFSILPNGQVGIAKTTGMTSLLNFAANQNAADAGADNWSGSAINTFGGDIATGRIFLQGYQQTGNDTIGLNVETSNRAVLYNYTDNRYLQVWNDNGNVEIPSGNLNVSSGKVSITSSINYLLELNPTTNNYGGIVFKYNGTNKGLSYYNSGIMIYGGEAGIQTRLQADGQYGLTILTNLNVGIGDTNPAYKFTVTGNNGDWNTAYIRNSDTVGTGLTLYNSSTGVAWSTIAQGTSGGANDNNLAWHLTAAGTSGEALGYKMTLTPSGNLGIGTDPQQDLHIKRDGEAAVIYLERINNNAGYLLLNGSINPQIAYPHNQDLRFATVTNSSFDNFSPKMTLTSAGYLLINRTSNATNQPLQVEGFIDITNVDASAMRVYNGSTFRGGFGMSRWGVGASNVLDDADMVCYAVGNLDFVTNGQSFASVRVNTYSNLIVTGGTHAFNGISTYGGISINVPSATKKYVSFWDSGTTTYGGGMWYDEASNITSLYSLLAGVQTQHVQLDRATGNTWINPSGGKVTIGIGSTQSEMLHIRSTSGDADIMLHSSNGQKLRLDSNSIRTTSASNLAIFVSNDTAKGIYLDSGGQVRVGTTSASPNFIAGPPKLYVVGNQAVQSPIGSSDNVRTGLAHYDSTTGYGAGIGGQIVLGYIYQSSSYTEGAIIKMYKTNSTQGDYSSGLKFQVRNNGASLSTKMTLNAGGDLSVVGSMTATGDVIAFSDKRVKTNIKTIDNGLEKISKLRGVSYNRTDIDDKSNKIGVIAQEVKEVLPEVVLYNEDDDKYGVDYGKMAGVFIEAIKELKAEVDSLKQEIKELKK